MPAAMKNSIVEDGPQRFEASEEYQARRRALWQAIEAKYAAHLANAGFFRGLILLGLRYREFRRELRKITPSPESCWIGVTESRRAEANPNDARGVDRDRVTTLEQVLTATPDKIPTTSESDQPLTLNRVAGGPSTPGPLRHE